MSGRYLSSRDRERARLLGGSDVDSWGVFTKKPTNLGCNDPNHFLRSLRNEERRGGSTPHARHKKRFFSGG